MGSLVSGITDALGLTNTKGQKAATKAANDANANAARSTELAASISREQIALGKDELQFQKDQYAYWKGIYGDFQENLANYFTNLDVNDVVALGLEAQQKEFQQAKADVKRTMAQRGFSGSGVDTATTAAMTMHNAEARAKIRAAAPKEVKDQQLEFLKTGIGQGTQILQTIGQQAGTTSNAFGTGVQSATGSAGNFLSAANNSATTAAQLSANNTNTTGSLFGTALGFFFG